MRMIIFVLVVMVLAISYFVSDWFVNYLSKDKQNPKELDDLEKEVVEKTDSYKEVVERVEETEKKVKKIKSKTQTKK